MSRVRGAPDAWTIAMACDQFAKAGMPVYEDRYRLAVTRVCRIPRVGEMPSGENGGRGLLQYPIGELQLLHSRLADWIVIREPSPGGI